MQNKKSVLIVGAGFSGLVQAYYLVHKGLKVVVCDTQTQEGGLLQTQKFSGFLSESAANAFLANLEIEKISQVIGIELLSAQSESKIRWFFKAGKLTRWPLSLIETLKLSFPLALLLIQTRFFGIKALDLKENENLKDWAQRKLGQPFANNLLEPAMQGVFASSSDKLDSRLILTSLFSRKEKGQLRGSISPKNGMGDWIHHLKKYLENQGVDFKLGLSSQAVDELINESLSGGDQPFYPLCFAVDLKSLKEMQIRFPSLQLPKSLKKTQTASLTSVQFFYKSSKIKTAKGFGCLFARDLKFHSLGVLFNQNIFAHRAENGFSETWILNDQKIKFSEMSSSALIRYVQSDRYLLFQEHEEPDYVKVYQWPHRLPLYDHNLAHFIDDLKKRPLKFCLVGHYLGDLGLSKIIFHAQKNSLKLTEVIHG